MIPEAVVKGSGDNENTRSKDLCRKGRQPEEETKKERRASSNETREGHSRSTQETLRWWEEAEGGGSRQGQSSRKEQTKERRQGKQEVPIDAEEKHPDEEKSPVTLKRSIKTYLLSLASSWAYPGHSLESLDGHLGAGRPMKRAESQRQQTKEKEPKREPRCPARHNTSTKHQPLDTPNPKRQEEKKSLLKLKLEGSPILG
jgi:hypothetical protein